MLVNGWEFLVLNPFDKNVCQSSQTLYNKNYKDSYYKFIEELCIPEPLELFEKNNQFTFYISCVGENDKIELKEKFEIKFLKSVFFKIKYKYIKEDLQKYYDLFNISIRNFYKTGDYIYLIIEKKGDQKNC